MRSWSRVSRLGQAVTEILRLSPVEKFFNLRILEPTESMNGVKKDGGRGLADTGDEEMEGNDVLDGVGAGEGIVQCEMDRAISGHSNMEM